MKTANVVSKQVLLVIPLIMRVVRAQIKEHSNLTVPQYRILNLINDGSDLIGQLAKSHGIKQPAMSKMVQVLFKQGYIQRTGGAKDRRQIHLALTLKGKKILKETKSAAEKQIELRIKKIDNNLLNQISESFEILQNSFSIENQK